MRLLLGYDIGSSSVKAALLDADSGLCLASASSPAREMAIQAPQPGWAEQDPEQWWQEVIHATMLLRKKYVFDSRDVQGIGIAYQMHGLVCVDKDQQVLRPAIIWCDSRAVGIGEQAAQALGAEYCNTHLLNAPGNFTASKLRWVREYEPALYARIDKVMLPGDFIAMRLTGEACTTDTGLSEGICWDFQGQEVALPLLAHYEIDPSLLAARVPVFGIQGRVTAGAAEQLGLATGTPVCYRAGDQPNNAFSLNVLEPGEAATTAGTSGVVYAVHDRAVADEESRVNTFVHVNNTPVALRNGVLMCLNGTGIMNSWLKDICGDVDYEAMNRLAATAPVGSSGLQVFPFGNGAERILSNRETGATVRGLNFNIHQRAHLMRAAQEGIASALSYGMSVMQGMGMNIRRVRAGHANMFLSPLFAEAFANIANVEIELYNTDGAQGAARGAGVGAGCYLVGEAHKGMRCIGTVVPDAKLQPVYLSTYEQWVQDLPFHLFK